MIIPTIEDIVWAQLLLGPAVKIRVRNERVLAEFASNGWTKHTSRRDEFEITWSGKQIAERRLVKYWPTWREDLDAFARAGLSPEDFGAWRLLKRQEAGQVPRHLKQINRRTLNAWLRRHSKTSSAVLPEPFTDVQVTIDEVTRMRLPPHSKLVLNNGESLECDLLMDVFGEVTVPERAWNRIRYIETPQSKLIFSIENKGAFVDFPAIPTATLVFLPGENTLAIRQMMARIDKQPIVHFGDLDPKGLEIFQGLLAEGFAIQHFVPNYVEEFISTHAQDSNVPWPERDYSLLHPVVSKLASKCLWLEQEALVLDHRFEEEIQEILARTE